MIDDMNTRPAVMILGASDLQVPIIRKVSELGFRSLVLDRDPESPGRRLADEFYEVSTTDVEAVVGLATALDPAGIVTAATDLPMRALAAASAVHGIPGPSTAAAYRSTDKWQMYLGLSEAGIATPGTWIIHGVSELVNVASAVPYILKPVDSSGSRGVVLVEREEDVAAAYSYASDHSPSGVILKQEVMVGSEVSVEGLCVGGSPHVVAVTDKITSGAPSFVEVGHSVPSSIDPTMRKVVSKLAMDAAIALGLENCGFHAEIILSDRSPVLIEIGARLGGDFITSDLVPLAVGVDLLGALVQLSTGGSPSLESTKESAAVVRFLFEPALSDRVPNVLAWDGVVSVSVSDSTTAHEVRNSTDRFGHVIVVGEDAISANRLADAVIAYLQSSERLIV